MSTATEALDAYDAGLCVIRARLDGSKAPVGSWEQYQSERPSREQVSEWFEDDYPGMGVVCGAASGNLEMFELEGRAVQEGLLDEFENRVRAADLSPHWEAIFAGYLERTPSGGIHVLWRCETIERNQPLARRLTPEGEIEVLIETRGEGGFTITAPSNGQTHPTGGAWELRHGSWDSITTISPDVRRRLLDVAASLDQLPEPESYEPRGESSDKGDRPGDEFEREHDCNQVLSGYGFVHHSRTHHGPNAGTHYTRPGKDARDGPSATVYDRSRHDGRQRVTLYSTSIKAPAEYLGGRRSLTSWQAHVALNFGGDFPAAARAWRKEHPRTVQVGQLDTPPAEASPAHARRVVATPLSEIRPQRVRWCWDGRLALGTLGLLAGREGLGKSTAAVTIGAMLTRGELRGEHQGTPKAVLVAATEDSFEHTIVPRFMAANADQSRVYRIDVAASEGLPTPLSLPEDIAGVEQLATELDAALLIVDPLISRLSAKLDSHRDGEVRQALEPLVAMADRAGMAVLGLIHFNKSGSSDPLDVVMASKAFTAVARSVHTIISDPDDDTGSRRYLGTPKNNLGRSDLPSLAFSIEPWSYDTDDGAGSTGRVVWGAETSESIADLMQRANQDPDKRSKEDECVDWLRGYMATHGPSVLAAAGKKDAGAMGFKGGVLNRAIKRAVDSRRVGGPGSSGHWAWFERVDGSEES